MQDFTQPPAQSYAQTEALVRTQEAAFFQRIYLWMCGGLIVSALSGYILSGSELWRSFLRYSSFSVLLVIAGQIGLVIAITALLSKISGTAVKLLFLGFAVSMGFTISLALMFNQPAVIAKAFFSAAAVYGAMAVYGLVTKRSLKAWGAFLFMGLAGLLLTSLANFFLGSQLLDFVVCWAGVIVFAGLTAYDHQKLRVMYASSAADGFGGPVDLEKLVCYGALVLYLDFINLFLFLVRIFGRGE